MTTAAPTATKSTAANNPMTSSQSDINVAVEKRDVLHAVDGRTGLYYSIPINKNAVNAGDFKKIKSPADRKHPAYQNELGLRIYDPGFSNTTVSESKITYM